MFTVIAIKQLSNHTFWQGQNYLHRTEITLRRSETQPDRDKHFPQHPVSYIIGALSSYRRHSSKWLLTFKQVSLKSFDRDGQASCSVTENILRATQVSISHSV